MRLQFLSAAILVVFTTLIHAETARAPKPPVDKPEKAEVQPVDEEEEGPFSRALEERNWDQVNKIMKDRTRHGMRGHGGSNPVPASPASLAMGKALFVEYCALCHGDMGKGDGVAAQHLIIKPANLQDIAKRYPDQLFFMQVAKGRGDMPAWYDMLDTQEIWHITNYVRTLGKK